MKKSLILLLACLSLFSCEAFATSAAGHCKVFNGNAIVTWTDFDDVNGFIHVWGATGAVTANSNTWTVQELSIDTLGSYYVTEPHLYLCESTGDVIALWQYYDDNTGLLRVGGATLPSGSSTWSIHLVSDSTNQQGLMDFDGTASVDATGNIIITWSSYNLTTADYDVLGATAVIAGGNTTWNNSFVIPSGAAPLMAKRSLAQTSKPSKGNPKVAPAHPIKDRKPPVKTGKRK